MARSGLEDLRNKHAGRLCFIAGCGPSLRHLSPQDAEPHLMIAINGAIVKFPNALYFFTCDPGVRLQHCWDVLRDQSKAEIIIGWPYSRRGEEGFGGYDSKIGESYSKGIEERIRYILRKPDENRLIFNASDRELIFGHSSVHCAAHLAYLMGCKPIVLIGCDCGREDGKHYHYEFPGHEQYADWIKPEYEKLHAPIDMNYVPSFVTYWDRMGADNPLVEFVNCGNAIIPYIPQAKLADVLKKHTHG